MFNDAASKTGEEKSKKERTKRCVGRDLQGISAVIQRRKIDLSTITKRKEASEGRRGGRIRLASRTLQGDQSIPKGCKKGKTETEDRKARVVQEGRR